MSMPYGIHHDRPTCARSRVCPNQRERIRGCHQIHEARSAKPQRMHSATERPFAPTTPRTAAYAPGLNMTENDEHRVRTLDTDPQMGSAERQLNWIRVGFAVRRQPVSQTKLCHLEEPVGIFTGSCQGPQGAPRSSEVASCKPCPPYVVPSDPASNTAPTEGREERPTSSDKELLVRWMPLLRHEEEVTTKDKDRTGKDSLASHGMARTILRLLGGNNTRPEGPDDEQ